ncbi:MAG TPA: enoyl-CoA hydratase-related protein [Gaiellales bacterium]|nr:enoyl-CoA hydratase-related protein [Gaiellales bacterium]
MSAVRLDRNGSVVTLTIDRPQTRNALDREAQAAIPSLLRSFALDGTRAVVLTGAGDVFCSGADLGWMRHGGGLDEQENLIDAAATAAMMEAVDCCPLPVIARVNGHALGGGAGLVACCDIAIAAEGARFGFTETRLGLIPAIVSPYVLRAIGPGHARSLFVAGERFPAGRALEIGLVHRVVAADRLDQAVADTVLGVLEGGPAAIAEAKRLVRDATAGLALGDRAQRLAEVRAGAEAQEGMAAFLERRKPQWAPRSPESS